jgi:uncharacterized phiE125 gp8 family phage protein
MTTRLISTDATGIAVEEAKLHLRVDHDDEDDLIQSLIKTAMVSATNKTGRSFAPMTWEKRLDAFPGGPINLHFPPVVEIASIEYKNAAGEVVALSSQAYTLAAASDSATLSPNAFWPEDATNIRITYTAGFESIPEPVVQWIMLHVGNWYKNREAVVSTQANELPFCESLIYPYKIWEV